jgi:hypothetical protein
MTRLLIRLLPSHVRSRYGDEVEELLQLSDHPLRDRLDLLRLVVRLNLEAGMQKLGRPTNAPEAKPVSHSARGVALVTALILLIPLMATPFGGVDWGVADFVFAGFMIFGTGFTYKLVGRTAGNLAYRLAVCAALGGGFILVWANLAVGVIGSEDEAANLMYFGVILVGVLGAAIARFRPQGMAYALVATALTQALVTAIALIAGMQDLPESSVSEILRVNAFFIALFVGAAWLFRFAARELEPISTAD